ncbi:acyl-CoA desaturase [Litoribacillus peritrichatus]|uniref:Acyl-CoA desaturase n=1 Tax=Litoribacillus peritrichatus TaxID=718191 RepID=A0ABP7MAC7_9GAMM
MNSTTKATTQQLPIELSQSLESDLNELRQRTLSKVGEEDAAYIRRIIRIERWSGIFGRISMVLGFIHPMYWVFGVLALAFSKILNNMEVGHNVMHGQYDWMNDPNINSRSFDWDNAGDSDSWRHYHNYEHHTYTNIIGKDRDFGYGLLRLSNDLPWRIKNTFQVFIYMLLSLLFEWGVAYHELAGDRVFSKKKNNRKKRLSAHDLKRAFFSKAGRQIFKDYIFFPLISGPMFLPVLLGNFLANLIRNLWTSTIIFCGHFTEDIHTFSQEQCNNETKGQWYHRQMLGSSNIEGRKWFHILTGHLSCQIEHHLFPDIPAHRYTQMAPEVQAIAKKHGIPYNTGRFSRQYFTVLKRIIKYSFPQSATKPKEPLTASN